MEALLATVKKNACRRDRNPAYLLRGILKCARCNNLMTTASTRKRKRVYRYYRCMTRDKRGRKKCAAGQIPAEAIETFVVDRIREASLGGLMAEQVRKRLQQQIEARRKALKAQKKGLPALIAKLADEGGKLAEMVCQVNDHGGRLMEARIEDVGARLAMAEQRLSQVERSLAELDRIDLEAGWVAKALDTFDAVWETMTTENRRRLMRALVREARIDATTGQVTVVLTDLGVRDEVVGW